MAYTVLQFKRQIANQLGKNDAATANTKRDEAALGAHRQFVLEHPWSWNWGTSALTFSGGSIALPTDYSAKWEPKSVYAYDDTTKIEYIRVALEDLASFEEDDTSAYRYALDLENGLVKSNHQATTVNLVYQKAPQDIALDGTDDADTLPYPDLTPPSKLAVGMYWLATERDETNFDRFVKDIYQPLLQAAWHADSRSSVPYRYKHPLRRAAMGWNNTRSY